MDESTLIRLDLRAPLVFIGAPGIAPFTAAETEAGAETAGRAARDRTKLSAGSERLFCFELDPVQARSIEPDRELLLGALLFAGVTGNPDALKAADAALVRLPAGLYLFAQRREAADRNACLDMAIEQQKDGLWERHEPEPMLYVRYLFEDGKPVTQVFRPCKG
ncbi:MAG: hypothetical protein LBS57_00010 [Treponema sp.]|jgi:hypothetical protein|nr:hypothetical protein [Treponema sp.]